MWRATRVYSDGRWERREVSRKTEFVGLWFSCGSFVFENCGWTECGRERERERGATKMCSCTQHLKLNKSQNAPNLCNASRGATHSIVPANRRKSTTFTFTLASQRDSNGVGTRMCDAHFKRCFFSSCEIFSRLL